jgi:hypothetical protein
MRIIIKQYMWGGTTLTTAYLPLKFINIGHNRAADGLGLGIG